MHPTCVLDCIGVLCCNIIIILCTVNSIILFQIEGWMTLSMPFLKELVLIAVVWIVIFTKCMFFGFTNVFKWNFGYFLISSSENEICQKKDLNWPVRAKNFSLCWLPVESWWFLKHNFGCKYSYFVLLDTIFVNLTVVCNRLPYLPMCKWIPCISQPTPPRIFLINFSFILEFSLSTLWLHEKFVLNIFWSQFLTHVKVEGDF